MKNITRAIFPAIYGLTAYATVRLLQDTASGFHFWRRPLLINGIEITLSIAVGYISWAVLHRICRYHERQLSVKRQGAAVMAKEIVQVAGVNALIVNATLTPMAALTDDGLSLSDFVLINTVPLLYMLIYYGWLRSKSFLQAYISQQVLTEKLTNDRLQTELQFLKAQYHPHFLFNALNTVYFQMDENVTAAKQSIEKLAGLLRYQLYDQQEKVSMEKELQYLEGFIDLQKVRTSKALQVNIKTDDRVKVLKVYPLLFLPLVENAFKYAGGDCCIGIETTVNGSSLCMTVTNSLPAVAAPVTEAGGIGLENLRRRLALLYPGKHTLTVEKEPAIFTAQLTLNTA